MARGHLRAHAIVRGWFPGAGVADDGAKGHASLTVRAMLHAREAWTYVKLGRIQASRSSVGKPYWPAAPGALGSRATTWCCWTRPSLVMRWSLAASACQFGVGHGVALSDRALPWMRTGLDEGGLGRPAPPVALRSGRPTVRYFLLIDGYRRI